MSDLPIGYQRDPASILKAAVLRAATTQTSTVKQEPEQVEAKPPQQREPTPSAKPFDIKEWVDRQHERFATRPLWFSMVVSGDPDGRRRPTIALIQTVVAQRCNIDRDEMQTRRRLHQVVFPRQIAMYLSKKMTLHSLPEIGRRFGGKDHTTVLHAVRKIERLAAQDVSLAQHLAELMADIEKEIA